MPRRNRNKNKNENEITPEDLEDFYYCKTCTFKDRPKACLLEVKEGEFTKIKGVGCGKEVEY